jgi:hypothetical protein
MFTIIFIVVIHAATTPYPYLVFFQILNVLVFKNCKPGKRCDTLFHGGKKSNFLEVGRSDHVMKCWDRSNKMFILWENQDYSNFTSYQWEEVMFACNLQFIQSH